MDSRSRMRTKSFSVPCPFVNDHLRMRSVFHLSCRCQTVRHGASPGRPRQRVRGRNQIGVVVGQPA